MFSGLRCGGLYLLPPELRKHVAAAVVTGPRTIDARTIDYSPVAAQNLPMAHAVLEVVGEQQRQRFRLARGLSNRHI